MSSVNSNTTALKESYEKAWSVLTSGRPSLADLASFGTIARQYAQTAEGERRLYDDLAKSDGVICTILEEVIEEARASSSSKERITPRGYSLSEHVIEQAQAKGFSLEQLIETVDSPLTAYESRRYPGQMKHIRDGLCVAVDPEAKKAITVFVDMEYTELRPDQVDKDAIEYGRKRQAAQQSE